jgi:RIO kinase 1
LSTEYEFTPDYSDLEPDPADAFVFKFHAVDEELGPDQRWSTWLDVERGSRGPDPRPDWVVTEQAAIDTELGVLKTGKEADVFLIERAVEAIGDNPAKSSLLAAKRYRTEEHRSFHRSTAYVEGRRTRNSRDTRAMAKKTSHGRSVAAGQWAYAEWDALNRLWKAGVPVPYPVQVDGTELLMEFIDDGEGGAAPRLAQVRPPKELLGQYFEQLRHGMRELEVDEQELFADLLTMVF